MSIKLTPERPVPTFSCFIAIFAISHFFGIPSFGHFTNAQSVELRTFQENFLIFFTFKINKKDASRCDNSQ
jgi:hypothetical protein